MSLNGFPLAAKLLLRDWRSGELRVLAAALVIAVASMATVGFFADRVERGLTVEANRLLGADLVGVFDRPPPLSWSQEAHRLGLRTNATVRFPSMAVHGERSLLVDVKAVDPGYPLRGALLLAPAPGGAADVARGIPRPGTVWVEERLLPRLGIGVGDAVGLGEARLKVAGILVREPDSGTGLSFLGPRILLNAADLPATGLIQEGSRIQYRLLVAGPIGAVERFRDWASALLAAGQRIEDIREARPEIRGALERAERFLGLASLVAVALAGVALALAARRHLQRHLDACALLRCWGASQSRILGLFAQQFLLLGLAAGLLGVLLGLAGQQALGLLLRELIATDLPAPGPLPALQGMTMGLVLLLACVLPPLIALSKVSPLRVLRRELGFPGMGGVAAYGLAGACMAGLILWEAQDASVGGWVLGGMAGLLAAVSGLGWLFLRLTGRLAAEFPLPWRFGLANLRRRALGSVIQMAALALGIMALLLLTLVRGDLLASWKGTLPADAPNQFLVSIQADQLQPLRAFFAGNGLAAPVFHPMVRGRLVAINQRPVSSADYADDRAKRLVDREFNLSWSRQLQDDNRIVAGRWWKPEEADRRLLSLEEGIAQTLGIRMGDSLTYDLAGTRIELKVSNLRQVDWDSFRVNFFAMTPPGVLEGFPVSYVTSFHLSRAAAGVMDRLVRDFPNVLAIDVAATVARVQEIMDQVARAVEFVFLFTLLAGVAVLYAAVGATRDERVYEAAVLRTLGASARQLRAAQFAEFFAIGMFAGMLAAVGASVTAYVLSSQVFHLPFRFNPWLWVTGPLAGGAGVAAAGWLATRGGMRHPPLWAFRNAA